MWQNRRISLDKAIIFQPKSIYIFLISRQKRMLWVLIRSASMTCFRWEIRKLLTWYPLLSRPTSRGQFNHLLIKRLCIKWDKRSPVASCPTSGHLPWLPCCRVMWSEQRGLPYVERRSWSELCWVHLFHWHNTPFLVTRKWEIYSTHSQKLLGLTP